MLIDEIEKSWTVFPSFLANEMRYNCWLFQYLKKRFIITSTCQVKRNKKVNEKVNKCIKRKSSSQGAVLQLSWDCLAAIKGLWDAPSLSWLFPLLAQSSWLDMWEWYISTYTLPRTQWSGRHVEFVSKPWNKNELNMKSSSCYMFWQKLVINFYLHSIGLATREVVLILSQNMVEGLAKNTPRSQSKDCFQHKSAWQQQVLDI
jgi:hypothetical protein